MNTKSQIYSKYLEHCNIKSDINELLPILYNYACKVKHITEFGVREVVSTWALLASNPEKIISYDIVYHKNIEEAKNLAKDENINLVYKLENSLQCKIEQTDLLFIDTFHTYNQLFSELNYHHKNVNKYIIMHDTSDCEFRNENFIVEQKNGLYPAIIDFLNMNKNWILHEKYANNNGLTILRNIVNEK